ncbi:MAG: DUF3347 domain-containing protein [Ginsengibacter sp.]
MKRLLAILFLAAVLFITWWFFIKKDTYKAEPKQEAVKIGKHSKEFNESVAAVVTDYLSLKSAFVDADTINVKINGRKFIAAIDSLKIDELRKDDAQILLAARQAVSDAKINAQALLQESALTEMREDFRMVSENLYPFLKTIGYEGQKLYWQNCPMAFGENKEGNWLSSTSEIINPYLGKNHPEYKSTMLSCGETKDSLK